MSDSSNDERPPTGRRMSLVEMFNPRSTAAASSSPANLTATTPESAQHRRGVSITTLGLTGSGTTQPSPYTAFARQRAASISTSSAASSPEFKNSFSDENAVIEEEDAGKSAFGSPPSPSFARRLSFGAQALKDVRQSGPNAPNGGEGFNWSEAIRDRSKRSPSFSSGNPFAGSLNRTKSMGTGALEPPKEMPKASAPAAPTKLKKPDHLGERMLRGDFMMD